MIDYLISPIAFAIACTIDPTTIKCGLLLFKPGAEVWDDRPLTFWDDNDTEYQVIAPTNPDSHNYEITLCRI